MLEPLLLNEPPSESLVPTKGRDSTKKRKQLNQTTNIVASELPNESLVTPPDRELSLISLLESENALPDSEPPGESVSAWSEAKEQLVSSPKSENALPDSEPPGESRTIVWDGDPILIEPLVMENALPDSELPGESVSAWSEAKEQLVSSPESENALPDSELASESPTSKLDYEEVTEPLVMTEEKAHVPKVRGDQIPKSLTGAALARRLGVSPGSISRNKTKDNFGQWTSQHDPDGISWYFNAQTFQSVVSSLPE